MLLELYESVAVLSNNGGRGVEWKFFQLVTDWKTENRQEATIGQLLESLNDIGTAGTAIRILNDRFSLDLSDFWHERV
eukprot:m.210303 g.210303  ORF g.210303 m.210303 type:complete len:78 (+) comp39744_c0_seq12:568-801(+)